MGRPWWYDSYWEKKEKRRRRFRWPSRKSWIWVALVLLSLLLSAASTGFQPDLFDWIHGFVSYFCRILALCIFIHVLLSWFRVRAYSWPITILNDLTNPILEPLRRIMPTFGGFDFSPMVAIFILYFIPSIVGRLIPLFI
ncbi:YggT family protein [Chloroflexota bacterium]